MKTLEQLEKIFGELENLDNNVQDILDTTHHNYSVVIDYDTTFKKVIDYIEECCIVLDDNCEENEKNRTLFDDALIDTIENDYIEALESFYEAYNTLKDVFNKVNNKFNEK